MKQCIRCLETKPLDEFYKHPQMADGHLNVCISCKRLDQKKYSKTSAGRATDKKRSAKPNRVRYLRTNAKKWRERNPAAYKAHNALNNALRDGRISKPGSCEDCLEKVPSRRLHGHHRDYEKPLEVEWLCVRCHGRRNPIYQGEP